MEVKSIYRYTSLESLIDIVHRKALTLVMPKTWNDPYESVIFSAMRTEEGKALIKYWLEQHLPSSASSAMHYLLSILESAYFGQCWTLQDESDAMWRIYSHDNMAIRIEANYGQLQTLEDVYIAPVEYPPELNLKSELQHLFRHGSLLMNAHEMYFRKRLAFQHEHEVRIISKADLNNVVLGTPGDTFPLAKDDIEYFANEIHLNDKIPIEEARKIVEQSMNAKGPATTKRVALNKLDAFIKSVMLHPQSPIWLNKTVANWCEENGIVYLGKSKLYTVEMTL